MKFLATLGDFFDLLVTVFGRSQCYREGDQAYRDGKGIESCFYLEGERTRKQWMDGYYKR